MLHIILLILKTAGFLILGILALVVLLTVVILLSPFIYRLDFSADNSLENAKGRIRFHWLMHLMSGEISYRNGIFSWRIRVAWKKFGDEADRYTTDGTNRINIRESHAGNTADTPEDDPADVSSDVSPAGSADSRTDDPVHTSAFGHEPERPPESVPDPRRPRRPKNASAKGTTGKRADRKKISRFYEKIMKIPEKIKYTFRRMCDKINVLKKKKERIASFLRSSTHQKAFSRLIKESRRLLRFLRPSDASADLEFGFSDPAYTGYILAGISIIYPMIGKYAQIRPDFEHKILKGNIFIRGKIRVLYGMIFTWNMLWDKNVRATYRHIRKFRL